MLYFKRDEDISKANGFTRGQWLAKSIKMQRTWLKRSRQALKAGNVYEAQIFLGCWKQERQAWDNCKSFGDK